MAQQRDNRTADRVRAVIVQAVRRANAEVTAWWAREAQRRPAVAAALEHSGIWLRETFSIRARLALWCATIMALILLLLSFMAYTIAENQLDSSIELTIKGRAEAIGAALMREQSTSQVLPTPVVVPSPVPTLPSTPASGGPTPSPVSTPDPASQATIQHQLSVNVPDVLGRLDLGFEVLDSAGRPKYVAATLNGDGLPLNAAIVNSVLRGAPATWYTALTRPTGPGASASMLAIYVQPLVYRPSPTAPKQIVGVVLAAKSLDDANAALSTLRRLLLLGDVVAILLASLGGWFIAERGLRPITTVTRTARAIAVSAHAAGLETRVPYEGPRDEVGELVTTFNDMLDALERVTNAQRRFVADASHEMRGPLTSIKGNLEFLRWARDLPESERSVVLAGAEAEATRLATLVNDLLLLARVDAASGTYGPSQIWLDEQLRGRRESVALDEVVMAVFRQAREQMTTRPKDLRLSVSKLQPLMILGDPGQIRQLVYILVDNAIKYTPSGGHVRLSLNSTAEGEAVLTVEDTGIGIAEKDLPHIFERFYRADEARTREDQGSGLGLAIARWIVEAHNGALDVQSTFGEGTTFTVRLKAEPREVDLSDEAAPATDTHHRMDAQSEGKPSAEGEQVTARLADAESKASSRADTQSGTRRAGSLARFAVSVSKAERPTLRQLRAAGMRADRRDPTASSGKHRNPKAASMRPGREKRRTTKE